MKEKRVIDVWDTSWLNCIKYIEHYYNAQFFARLEWWTSKRKIDLNWLRKGIKPARK
jgi:hypothetical protein